MMYLGYARNFVIVLCIICGFFFFFGFACDRNLIQGSGLNIAVIKRLLFKTQVSLSEKYGPVNFSIYATYFSDCRVSSSEHKNIEQI